MTTLSSLPPASRLSNALPQNVGLSPVLPGKVAPQSSPMPQQSAIVTVGAGSSNSAPDQTYSMPRTLATSPASSIWMTRSNDTVSSLMAGNFFSHSLTNRLKGLGSALLDMVKSGASSFSQSVTQSSAESAAVTSASGPTSFPWADEKLVIKTQSGVEVNISLNTQEDRLAVKMTSSGELSEAERIALGNLSGAFQDAIDGLNAKPPHLDLGGLTQFDSTVLSSVDFHSNITLDKQAPQTLDFHADGVARTLSLDGPIGTVNVKVDMLDASNWGSPKQRTAAIDSYLKQFDQAASRGNADASLMAMFKDAFSQMNSNYAVSPLQHPSVVLAKNDYAMLTGLADFDASITQMPKAPNPMHLSELDTFFYQTSQNTNIRGASQLDRSISQHQQSHLTASYHKPLVPDIPLELTTQNKSQNYYYEQIDDTAESSTDIEYTKGRLTKALSTLSASQSTHISKYEMGKLTEDTTTPFNASLTQDILATLKPFLENTRPRLPLDVYRYQQVLSDVHDQIFLRANPADLHAKGWNIPIASQD